MNVVVHILCFNEAAILSYVFRHYATFATKIILHDAGSTDGSLELAKFAGVEVRDWKTDGVNDMLAKQVKEQSWLEDGPDVDWEIMVDADELIYFPEGAWQTLEAYERAQLVVVKPHGFEMLSDKFPTGTGQLYDEVTHGAPDDEWYAKPVLFSPRRLKSIIFSCGAHTCWAVTKDGLKIENPQTPSEPPTYLLHCHHIRPLAEVAARYNVQRSRLSPINVKMKWGNFDPGMKHAMDKRKKILAGLKQVIV